MKPGFEKASLEFVYIIHSSAPSLLWILASGCFVECSLNAETKKLQINKQLNY